MKKGIALVSLLFTLFCATNYAFASFSSRLDGKPDKFMLHSRTGYFIWQDEKGLHIRTTSSGERHVFTGTIRTDGVFEDTYESSRAGDDFFRINGDRDKITYRFTNAGNRSGIDIYVNGGTYVAFNLSMDGEAIDPDRIFIGGDGWHPGSHKFMLRHDADPDRYSYDRTVIIVGRPYWWWHFSAYWGPGWHHGWYYRPWHRW